MVPVPQRTDRVGFPSSLTVLTEMENRQLRKGNCLLGAVAQVD